jgi:hypothetical protein
MKQRRFTMGAIATAAVAMAAVAMTSCSSAGGGPGDMTTFSCTISGIVCIQGTEFASEVAAEQKACTGSQGTFAMAPCPSTGFAGCCTKPAETDCYFPGLGVNVFQSECTKDGGTWTGSGPSDGGAGGGTSGAAAFVGTWARSGTQTVTCNGNITTNNITGDLVIALDAMSGVIDGTPPDGCVTKYTVSSNVATANSGQSCSITTDAGVAEVITTNSRTLTLSADGTTLAVSGSETIDKTATQVMCSAMSTGTYTKM